MFESNGSSFELSDKGEMKILNFSTNDIFSDTNILIEKKVIKGKHKLYLTGLKYNKEDIKDIKKKIAKKCACSVSFKDDTFIVAQRSPDNLIKLLKEAYNIDEENIEKKGF